MLLSSLVLFPFAVATLIPRELLFSGGNYTAIQLSPNGRYIAYIASDQNKVKNVFVKCITCKNARQVTFEKSTDVYGEYKDFVIHWSGKNVIIYQYDNDGDENWKLFKKNISEAEMAANPEKKTVISDKTAVQAMFIADTLEDTTNTVRTERRESC
ncbi:hypothetical protein COOONC_10335 [Cooperia oncophora]